MKIYFKRIWEWNFVRLGKRESREVHLTKRPRSERMGWEWKTGVGGWMTISTFSIAYHSHLDSWVCRRWLIKIWRPMAPWIYSVCICVWACVYVTMHICKCMHACTCVSEHVAHMHKYVSLCVHMYIYLGAPHKYSYLIP